MRRVLVTVRNAIDRDELHRLVERVPAGTRFEVKEQKRSLDQNSKMWALLTEVSRAMPTWHGQQLAPSDWKLLFLDALRRELRPVPSIDGKHFVNLGTSSSDLSKGEMSDMIELIYAFGAKHNIPFQEPSDG